MSKRFGFLLFDQFEDLDFAGPWEFITVWAQKFNGPRETILISEKAKSIKSIRGLTVITNTDFQNCPPLDYLLIPGGEGTRTEVNNPHLISFIQHQASTCHSVLSVCTGSFLLQAAGLLKNKKATTHWASLERLKVFQEVRVMSARFIKDGNIWTSAGVSAGIDMTLAFIAETVGEAVAAEIQLYTEYYPLQKIYALKGQSLPSYVKLLPK